MLTLNNVITNLNAIATSHKQINSFGFGDIWEINTSGTIDYPLMWVVPSDASIVGADRNLKFNLIFCDIVKNGETNENDVLSDQLEIAQDVIAQLNYHGYNWVLDKNITLTDFTERFTDVVAGWSCEVTIKEPFAYNRCQIPTSAVGVTSGASASSGGVTGGTINIYVNGILNQTVTTTDFSTETLNISP